MADTPQPQSQPSLVPPKTEETSVIKDQGMSPEAHKILEAAAPDPTPSQFGGLRMSRPIETGVTAIDTSNYEKTAVEQAGGQLPAEILRIMAKQRHMDEEDLRRSVAEQMKNGPTSVTPEGESDLENLPPEKQQLYRDLIADMMPVEGERSSQEAATPQPVPSKPATTPPSRQTIVPQVEQAGQASQAEPRPLPGQDANPQPSPVAETEKPATENEENPAERVDLAANVRCQHCGWPVDQGDVPDPTEKQLDAYLESTFSGVPYREEYKLYNGKIRVVFRELNTPEVEAILEYVANEARKDPDASNKPLQSLALWNEIYQRRRAKLRLALSLQALEFVGSSRHHVFSGSLAEWGGDLEYVQQQVELRIPSQSLASVLARTFNDFERLVDKITTKAHEPNF